MILILDDVKYSAFIHWYFFCKARLLSFIILNRTGIAAGTKFVLYSAIISSPVLKQLLFYGRP